MPVSVRVPEAGVPPAVDVAVPVISGGLIPALHLSLGAPLAAEVAHVAIGTRQAHQPLGACRALVVVIFADIVSTLFASPETTLHYSIYFGVVHTLGVRASF